MTGNPLMNTIKTLHVDYYSDVLCVWAWIAQPRLQELQKQWGNHLEIRHRFIDIFGDALQKIPARWGESDGFEKFSDHVIQSAHPYDESVVSSSVWRDVRPRSSMQAHIVLRAAGHVGNENSIERLALAVRRAFFEHARDISQLDVLLALVEETGICVDDVRRSLSDGSAMALLSRDLKIAQNSGIKGSPTWVLNEGRQILYGNVGYRILNANLEELLKHPADESSWC
jgi:predicted DsbA family dithiol-disulfide isomerase